MTVDDHIRELFEDFDSNHPAFDRIDQFDDALEQDTRNFILHKMSHWFPVDLRTEGGELVPHEHREYIALMFGLMLGAEFHRRGYEVRGS